MAFVGDCGIYFALYDLYPRFTINRQFKTGNFDIASPIGRQCTWILRYINGNQFFRLSPNTTNK